MPRDAERAVDVPLRNVHLGEFGARGDRAVQTRLEHLQCERDVRVGRDGAPLLVKRRLWPPRHVILRPGKVLFDDTLLRNVGCVDSGSSTTHHMSVRDFVHVADEEDLASLARVGGFDDPDWPAFPAARAQLLDRPDHRGILGRQDERLREEVEDGPMDVAHPAEVAQQRVLLCDSSRLGEVIEPSHTGGERVL
eukprot:scaffold255317_cov33-Tisochrysis_lutea.AAC.1